LLEFFVVIYDVLRHYYGVWACFSHDRGGSIEFTLDRVFRAERANLDWSFVAFLSVIIDKWYHL